MAETLPVLITHCCCHLHLFQEQRQSFTVFKDKIFFKRQQYRL
uniref:Uncharacterized protein n=1 Tax=Anguilla anguilla TaxID=7936 RepID=A0A0E9W9Z9_ANGAN